MVAYGRIANPRIPAGPAFDVFQATVREAGRLCRETGKAVEMWFDGKPIHRFLPNGFTVLGKLPPLEGLSEEALRARFKLVVAD